jgi:pimeloyl-ACP methyl ester carboxylesterase
MRYLPSLPRSRSRLRAASIAAVVLGAAALYVRTQTRRAERENPPDGGFVDVDGTRIHYIERGEGPAVVLFHGNGTMGRELELSGLVALAAERYRVIVFDRPGFGHTERPRHRTWTPQAQAELFAAALRQLGVERATVVGHSWGTLVALALALDYPHRVRGAVLVSGYFTPTFRPDFLWMSLPALPLIGTLLRHTITPLAARLLWRPLLRAGFGPPPTPRRFSLFPKWMALRPSQLRAAAAESALLLPAVFSVRRRFAELRVPTVIMAGEEDRVLDAPRHARALHAKAPHSTMWTVPHVGHMLHHAFPGRVLQAIDAVSRRAPAVPDSLHALDKLAAATGEKA